MGKNIDPGPKGHRFEPRLHPPLRMISARNRTARRDGKGERGAKNLVTLLDLCVSSLRRGHANLLCIVPILSDDLRGESNKLGFPDIRLAMAKEGFPGTTELRRQKPGQANGQEHRPRTQKSQVQAPVASRPSDEKRQESNRQT